MFTFQCSYASRLLRLMILLSVLLASLPVRLASATSLVFTVPKAVVDESVWKAIWRNRYGRAQGVEMVLYSTFLIQLYKNNPTLEVSQAISRTSELRQKYEGATAKLPRKTYDVIVRTMFDVALEMPSLSPTIKNAWAIFVDQGDFPALDSAASIAAMMQRFELADSLREREESILQTALDLAKQNPRFADAYDQLTGVALNASIKNPDARALMTAHPAVYVPPRIRENILPDGTVVISIDELKGLSQTEFDKLDATLTNLRSTLVTIDANQKVILDYVNDQKKREADAALAKAKSEEEALALEARKSALFIISTFVGLQDEKLGKAIKTYFTSGFEIADALSKWLEATAKLDGLDKFTNMSTMVMTGNVLGAVMNVVSLFKGSGPSPDKLILEAIAKLRQQVDNLRKEMHQRFDRIDRGLNLIFTSMQDRFNLIDLQLGKINGNVQEIQRTLVGIELSLSRIERNNYEFLDAGFRRPLLDAINGAVDYQARTGTAMPYQPDFIANENVFQGWGTIHALDALSTGPTQRDFSDAQVLAELNAFPLDANINYLNGWLAAHGLPPFASERLANLRDWTFASRAYSRMGLDWPQHIQRISPERQAALDGVGAKLEAATRRISTLDTPSGPQGNTPLFTNVITYYKDKLAALDGALLAQTNSFTQEVQTVRLQRDKPFDLWGGVDQSLIYLPPEFEAMVCGLPGSWPFQGVSNLKSLVPNGNRYVLAEYMKRGALKACLSAAWVDTKADPFPCNPKLGCKFVSKFQFTLEVKFVEGASEILLERRVFKYENFEATNGSAESHKISRWNDPVVRAKFATQSISELTAEEAAQRATLLNKVSNDLQEQLRLLQLELYVKLFNELQSGSLRPVTLELSGAKALLDSFITLGLPSAVANDDLLRALMFGSQRVADDGVVTDFYGIAISNTTMLTTTQLLTDTRAALNLLAVQRTNRLDSLLRQYLDAIGANTHAEAFDLIADARLELRLAQRLAKLDGATTKTQVFLPIVRK